VGPPSASERLKDAAQHRRKYHSLPLERRREINREKYTRRRSRLARDQAELAKLQAMGNGGQHADLVARIALNVMKDLNQHLANREKEERQRWAALMTQREEARERFFRDM
jgi:hypothetical protein